MEDFREQVKKGFVKCRTDIEDLYAENNDLKSKVSSLNDEVSELKLELKGINIALNYIKEFNQNITNKTSQPQSEQMQAVYQENVQTIEIPQQQTPQVQFNNNTQVKQQKATFKDPYEALLAFKAKANKREILKQKLLSMIGDNGINLSELKFLFVEHYRYCSKATYYNYLKELELEKSIRIERENSKNYIYLNNSMKLEREI